MNNEIKQLAEQAGFTFWEDEEWNPGEIIDWASNYDREIVKYTELVVTDVFDRIKAVNTKQAAIMHEDLKKIVLDSYRGDCGEGIN